MLASSKGGIQSMKDLDGKKVAVCARGGTADMLALWAADHAGVRVTAVPTGCAGMYTATKAGHTDAFASPPGASLKLIASGEMRPLMDLSDKMDPTYPNVIVASESATTRKAPQLRAFLAATFKALKYMQDNRAYGLKFLKAYSEETDDKANEQTYEAVTLNQSVTGAINKEWLKNSLRIAAKAWDMEELQKIDPASVYNDKFLPAVN
jgi:ABC-type nitrate/sulfonate/bicarbonate transport system substrate-binding protein